MKKITTVLGLMGVVCFFSACSSDSDDIDEIVAPRAEIESSSSAGTAPDGSSASKKPTINDSSTVVINDSTTVNDTVKTEYIISSTSKYTEPYYSSATVFCWTKECEEKYANAVSSSSAAKSSSSLSIEINMSSEAPVYPKVTETQMIDQRDQQAYALTTIGGVHWMASDLKYATADGSICYESSDANCKTYGRLYTFAAAKKACPTGWRLPNRAEAQAAIEATNMPWSFSGRCSGSDCKYADGMGFHWTAAAQQDGDKTNVDQCSGSTAVIIVEKNPDSEYAAEPANFFQVDCQAKLFSVRCVEAK